MRTLYRHGRLYSPVTPDATAMVIQDGVIAWIGDEDGLGTLPAGTDELTVHDLQGAFVGPAFVDAHVHTTATGLALTGLDLSGTPSLAAALHAVDQLARSSRGRPILGSGWDETRWPERRAPTAAELDRAGYGGSVYLARVDGHSAVVSSVLLASVAGVSSMPGYGAQGQHTRDAHDALRIAAFTALGPAQLRDLQRVALRHAASLGVGCVHEMAGPAISSAEDLDILLTLSRTESLPEVIGYWGELHGIDTARRLGAVGAAGDLFCDGSLGSHTAALTAPYEDRPGTLGELRYTTEDIAAHITECVEAGLQAGFHVIGDAAIDQVLDAFDQVSARLGRRVGAGHRLEHVEFVRDPARLAASGLIASMQPAFDATWGGPAGMYADRLGPQRARQLNRFADLAAAGVPLAFGSDAPVTAVGPWEAVRAASHSHDASAAIGAVEAFQAHTRAGWRAARKPGLQQHGQLVAGAPATFAAWDTGPLHGPLPDVRPGVELPTCVLTMVAGTEVHRTVG